MLQKKLTRFYKMATLESLEAGFGVRLDEHLLKTPARRDLRLPTKALAKAIAGEWDQQDQEIDPRAMPMMSFAATAIDSVGPARETVLRQTLDYGDHDLICYWASMEQPALQRRQRKAWQPLLDWAAESLGAPLTATRGITSIDQAPEVRPAFEAALSGQDDLTLTAVASVARMCGSLTLAIAMSKGRLTAEETARCAHLDETYQAELWGQDSEARDRLEGLAREIKEAARFLSLL